MSAGSLEELSIDECLTLLRAHNVGRIAVIAAGLPLALPVNYRVVDDGGQPSLLIVRTREGNVIDRAMDACLEIDGVDPVHLTGWSVIARGPLRHLGLREGTRGGDDVDPYPWVLDRGSWLALDPAEISGRRLRQPQTEWALSLRAYL